MKIVKNISEITQIVSDLHKNKKQINLIPTMGNIHEGHLSLVNEANKFCLLYTSPSPRDGLLSRMPSSA